MVEWLTAAVLDDVFHQSSVSHSVDDTVKCVHEVSAQCSV